MPITMGMLAGGAETPTYIGKGGKAAAAGSCQPNFSSATVPGDLVLIVAQVDQDDNVNVPAGWNTVINRKGGQCRLVVMSRIYQEGDGTSVVVTHQQTDHLICQALTFRGVRQSAPIHATRTTVDNSNGKDVYILNVTTTVDNALVLSIVAQDHASNSPTTSGWANPDLVDGVELTDINTDIGWDGGFAIYAGYKVEAGPVAPTTAVIVNAKFRVYASIALEPGP